MLKEFLHELKFIFIFTWHFWGQIRVLLFLNFCLKPHIVFACAFQAREEAYKHCDAKPRKK